MSKWSEGSKVMDLPGKGSPISQEELLQTLHHCSKILETCWDRKQESSSLSPRPKILRGISKILQNKTPIYISAPKYVLK